MIVLLIAVAVLVAGFVVHMAVSHDSKGTVMELGKAAMWTGLLVTLLLLTKLT